MLFGPVARYGCGESGDGGRLQIGTGRVWKERGLAFKTLRAAEQDGLHVPSFQIFPADVESYQFGFRRLALACSLECVLHLLGSDGLRDLLQLLELVLQDRGRR